MSGSKNHEPPPGDRRGFFVPGSLLPANFPGSRRILVAAPLDHDVIPVFASADHGQAELAVRVDESIFFSLGSLEEPVARGISIARILHARQVLFGAAAGDREAQLAV